MINKSMIGTTEIIEKAAGVHGQKGTVRKVFVTPMADSEGHDALGVTLVLANDKLTGGEAIELLVDINQALLDSGDERFAILDYVTEDELATEDDLRS